MVRSLEEILGGLDKKARELQATAAPVGPESALALKLKGRIHQYKDALPVPIEQCKLLFNDCITWGKTAPLECKHTIKASDGTDHPIRLDFCCGFCEIVCELFPQPFLIIPDDMPVPEVKASIYTVSEFAGLYRLAHLGGVVEFDAKPDTGKRTRGRVHSHEIYAIDGIGEKHLHGVLYHEEVFFRNVSEDRHFVKMYNGWGMQDNAFQELLAKGCKTIVYVVKEKHDSPGIKEVIESRISDWVVGVPVRDISKNKEAGVQRFLSKSHWERSAKREADYKKSSIKFEVI